MDYVVPIVSVAIAFVSVIVAICTFATNRKDKSSSKFDIMETSLIKLNMKTDQICNTTNETRTDIKAMTVKINELDKEVEVLKRDLTTAFHRIDELRGDMNDD